MGRGGAAAASQGLGPRLGDLLHPAGELLRPHVEDGAALLLPGQAGVGVHQNGQGGELPQPPGEGQHLLGPQAAVEA